MATKHNGVAVWTLGRVPNGYWYKRPNRVAYMDWLGKRLGYREPDDWYGLQRTHFKKNRGGGLLQVNYNDSPLQALDDYMPKRTWLPWLMSRTPNGFWCDEDNRREYMDWLAEKLEVRKSADWYRVTPNDFAENGGAGLLVKHYSGILDALCEYLPRYKWEEWRFITVPQGFWKSAINHKRFMDYLKRKLNVRTPEMWYGVKANQVRELGGSTFVNYHGESMLDALRDYMPHYDWKPWLFQCTPRGYWDNPAHRYDYLCWLGKTLGYRRPTDWYQITKEDIQTTGGGGMLCTIYRYSLWRVLQERYPGYRWNPKKLRGAGRHMAGRTNSKSKYDAA